MKINKIKLINWQKFSNLILDFSENVNVISGRSNMGKSSIRRAIEWICFNANISEKDYRREGTDETSVTIYLDSGFEIERVRSNSINRYIIRKEGCEDKVFDSVGREIPEEVKVILNVDTIKIDNDSLNLNIAEQLTLPFLLDKSASFRAKLFNKLTGNEVLDKLFKSLNKESLRISKELKSTEIEIESQVEEIKKTEELFTTISDKVSIVDEEYNKIVNKLSYYEELKSLAEKLDTNNKVSYNTKEKLKEIVTVSDTTITEIKQKIERFTKIKNTYTRLSEINLVLAKKLEDIPTIDIEALKKVQAKLNKLNEISNNLESLREKEKKADVDLRRLEEVITASEAELKEVWKNIDVCPTCKQKVCKHD